MWIEFLCNVSKCTDNHNYENISLSPQRRTPLREDSICRLLEHSCDDISDDDEIELLVEEGQVPVLRSTKKDAFLEDQFLHRNDQDDESDSISLRDSYTLGAGCLPCTPKSSKKGGTKNLCKHGKSSNWCCGVVASTVKKTAKKF